MSYKNAEVNRRGIDMRKYIFINGQLSEAIFHTRNIVIANGDKGVAFIENKYF